ncbi:MAG: DUF4932 domain-containing protein [Thermococcus sp.]|nr:DUF4932 domain-containing protein [Thermococcus sp.]
MKRSAALIIVLMFLSSAIPTGAYDADSRVSVTISPNSELLSVVYYLAFGRSDPFVIDRGGYLDEVDSYFAPYRNHRAVQMLREYIENATSIPEKDMRLFYTEYYLLLCTEPPELQPWAGINDPWTIDFIGALRDFARESDFMTFYRNHQDYYMEDLEIYENAISLLPPDEFMGHYMDVSNVRFEFHHPFLVAIHGHSFNPVRNGVQIYGAGGMVPLVRRDPQRTVWSHKTARDTMFGLPLNRDYIENRELDELIYLTFIYHELGHDITLDGLNTNYDITYSLRYLEDTIEEDMPYLARYDIHLWGPTGMIPEGFADGWADFALKRVNPAYAELAMWMQMGWGEFWIEDMVEIYEKYAEKSVKEGKPLSDYVADMMDNLKAAVPPQKAAELYQKRVPVTPLKAFDRGAVAGRVVVVYGTQTPDPTGTRRDKETAEAIAENLRVFYSQWPNEVDVIVKADINVTQAELKENLLLGGGPVANKIVAELQEEFPLRFEEVNGKWVLTHTTKVTSFVLLDDGSPLRELYGNVSVAAGSLGDVASASVLMAIRNPYNEDNYLVWIAGENRELTALFQNPTYYLSSYEIWSKNGIEMGFYVQPLVSS